RRARARVERGRPALLPLPHARADPRLLRLPLRALRREARRMARRREGRADRDRLPAGPRLRPRTHDRRREGRARRLHEELRPVPVRSPADRRIAALRAIRAVVPEHHSLFGGDRLIAKVDDKDPKDIDYPYYVTAHEVAHQWWAHQVVGADVQGATMLSETLAQYSALMVMKHRYGDAKMKRFLKYELDAYLIGRATERKAEQPLYRNEDQPYIHYRKGSLAMYALQDYIGEDAVNRALASFVHKWAFRGPPYP